MPGINPDPAYTISLEEFFDTWRKTVPQIVADIRKEFVAASSSLSYASFSRSLPEGVPQLLLAADQARVRALLRASNPNVFIGTMSELQSGSGYQLSTVSGDEIKTVDDVFVLYTGSPNTYETVYVWVERSAS